MAENPLIVGRVPFLVCAPFFHATLPGLAGARFLDGVPSFLNRELHAGRVDCAPSSSFEYGLHHRDYRLFPGISTSSRLEMKSVLLLSHAPWEDLDGARVALSPDSDTSNVLFRILCKERFRVSPALEGPGEPAARVFIGDAALSESLSGRWPYRYDLAGAWTRWQGLPFSFGLWMIRRDALAAKRPQAAGFHAALQASLAAFREAPDQALDAWTRAYPSKLPRSSMLEFYETADYRFTADHARSLEIFYRLALEAGFLPEMPALAYAEV